MNETLLTIDGFGPLPVARPGSLAELGDLVRQATGAIYPFGGQTQIAAVEDGKYPAADFRAPAAELNVPMRASGYARHQFQGLNVFLLVQIFGLT